PKRAASLTTLMAFTAPASPRAADRATSPSGWVAQWPASRTLEALPPRSRITSATTRSASPIMFPRIFLAALVSFMTNPWSNPLLLQLHVQPQPTDLVGQDVEAGRGAGFEGVLALDHRLVNLGPALHVVRLDGEEFLEHVSGAVGLQGP